MSDSNSHCRSREEFGGESDTSRRSVSSRSARPPRGNHGPLRAIAFEFEILPDEPRDEGAFFVAALTAIGIEARKLVFWQQHRDFVECFLRHWSFPHKYALFRLRRTIL